MVGIFKNMENRYLSIDCTKICNNSKRTKMTQNEVIQRTTSDNHVLNQESCGKPFINRLR